MPPTDTDPATAIRTFLPIGVAVLVLILRNARPRRLRIETLWVFPVLYLGFLGFLIYEAWPQLTWFGGAIIGVAFLAGSAIGWQRGRLMQIHIHPDTHEFTSRASAIGLAFIFAILAVRYFGASYLVREAAALNLPVASVLDGLIALTVAMLTVQRLEIWLRARQLLAEARAHGGGVDRIT